MVSAQDSVSSSAISESRSETKSSYLSSLNPIDEQPEEGSVGVEMVSSRVPFRVVMADDPILPRPLEEEIIELEEHVEARDGEAGFLHLDPPLDLCFLRRRLRPSFCSLADAV